MKRLDKVLVAWEALEKEWSLQGLGARDLAFLALRLAVRSDLARQEPPNVQLKLIEQAWADFEAEAIAQEFYLWNNVYAMRDDPWCKALLAFRDAIGEE